MALQTCPTIDLLEDFLLGKSREIDQVTVADHLLVCPTCACAVETMSANDELTLALSNQNPPPTADVGAPQLAKAIEVAKELKPQWI